MRFLAILELYREGKVELQQARTFGEIEVEWTGTVSKWSMEDVDGSDPGVRPRHARARGAVLRIGRAARGVRARAGPRHGPSHRRGAVRPAGGTPARTGGADSSCATSPAAGACTPTPTPRRSWSSSCCPRARRDSRRRPWRRSSIVAYKQPVTRHQVNSIRGVNSDGVCARSSTAAWSRRPGARRAPGRPVLYATTPGFLERLGPAVARGAALARARCWEWPTWRNRPRRNRVADDETPAAATPDGRGRARRRTGGRDRRGALSERLQRALARAGYGSRRACEEIIAAGRVTLNGTVATLGDKVEVEHDRGAGRRSHA